MTTDTMSVATNADIVVELIGGTGVARKFVLAAIMNPALPWLPPTRRCWPSMVAEIYAAAEAKGVDIYFEASVGGAIPFLKPLRESLVGDKVTSMLGIVNGTTNYILDEMTTKGLDFDDVLKDAQAKGYAEADPTGDIEGYDAANKAAIMATLGFHTNVTIDDVSVEGITKITADDIAAATAENKVIKLLAVVENGEAGVSARVYPALISNEHPLASVHGSFNAVFVKAEAADDLMFYGRGAGGAPTASAVVGDVVTEARHIAQGCTGPTIPLYKDFEEGSDRGFQGRVRGAFRDSRQSGRTCGHCGQVRRAWRVHQWCEPGSQAHAEGSGLRRRTAAAAPCHAHDRRAYPA
ncbi:MAG: homoserine dehydrogenase [Bifidobacterium pseudocatenulatum]